MIELAPLDLHIVLYQPEIPANTGNIGRLCVGTGASLHLIKPFRFLLGDRELKRAGLDYWPRLKLFLHDSLDEIHQSYPSERIFLCTTKTSSSYSACGFRSGDVFVFGPETKGLPEELLSKYPEQCIGIPMTADIRSINLANSAAIILYEAVRQLSLPR